MKTCKKLHKYEDHLGGCPECRREYYRSYVEKNKEKISNYKKEYAEKNKEKISEKNKKRYLENKDIVLKKVEKYRKNNREKVLKNKKRWYCKNKEVILEKMRDRYRENKSKISNRNREYRSKNKERISNQKKQYRIQNKDKISISNKRYKSKPETRIKISQDLKKRKNSDPLYRLKCKIRSLIFTSFKRKKWSKKSKTQQILGCTFEELKTHLEKTAIKNYGSFDPNVFYHIDHILPIALARNEEEMLRLSHYSNLQYLTEKDNLSKKAKVFDENGLEITKKEEIIEVLESFNPVGDSPCTLQNSLSS